MGVDRPGSFAEYLSLPAVNAFPLPDGIDDETAAILDPLGNATHTTLSFDLVGEDVLITGAGPIGIMSVAIARHVGARYHGDHRRQRLPPGPGGARWAPTAPSTWPRNPWPTPWRTSACRKASMSAWRCPATRPRLRDLLRAMNHGGRVALLGIPPEEIPLDLNEIIFKGLHIKGIYGREMFETWYKMTAMLQSSLDITPILTHRFAIDDFQQGFDVMRSGQSGKVVLDWAAN